MRAAAGLVHIRRCHRSSLVSFVHQVLNLLEASHNELRQILNIRPCRRMLPDLEVPFSARI